jgi:hypothetical protein
VLVPVQITTIGPDVPAISIAVDAIATKISAIVINIPLFSMCFSEIMVAIRAIAIDISFIGSNVPALFGSIFHVATAHVLTVFSAVSIDVCPVVIDVALITVRIPQLGVSLHSIPVDVSAIGIDVALITTDIALVLAQVSPVLISVAVLCVNAHRGQQHQTKTQDFSSHILSISSRNFGVRTLKHRARRKVASWFHCRGVLGLADLTGNMLNNLQVSLGSRSRIFT